MIIVWKSKFKYVRQKWLFDLLSWWPQILGGRSSWCSKSPACLDKQPDSQLFWRWDCLLCPSSSRRSQMRSWGQKLWVRLRSRRKTILGRSEGWWFWSCSTRWTVLCASRCWSWKLLQSSKLQYSRLEEIRAKMPPSRCKWSDNVLPRFDFVHTFSESANSRIVTCPQGQFFFDNYHLLKTK